jgi:hypothetical protein
MVIVMATGMGMVTVITKTTIEVILRIKSLNG